MEDFNKLVLASEKYGASLSQTQEPISLKSGIRLLKFLNILGVDREDVIRRIIRIITYGSICSKTSINVVICSIKMML